jgi:hypothetical protein
MLIIIAILSVFSLGESIANVHQVKGTVTSLNNKPLGGVNVLQKGTSNGTATDMNGNFTIYLPEGPAVLMVLFLKQKPLEHPINIREGFQYQVHVHLAEKSQTFNKGYAVTGELPLNAPVITGRVSDQDSHYLSGVRIIPEDSFFKTTTDVKGHFSIPVSPGDNVLSLMLPGFKSLDLRVHIKEGLTYSLEIVLIEDKGKYRKLKSFIKSVEPADPEPAIND